MDTKLTTVTHPQLPSASSSRQTQPTPESLKTTTRTVQTSSHDLKTVPTTSPVTVRTLPETTRRASKNFTYTVKVPPGKTYIQPPPRQSPMIPKISKTYSTHTIATFPAITTVTVNLPSTTTEDYRDQDSTTPSERETTEKEVFVTRLPLGIEPTTYNTPETESSVYTPPAFEEELSTTTTTITTSRRSSTSSTTR